MSARIDIVNVALGMLSADPITSIEDDAPEALLMKVNYDMARDATLEAYEWTFATRMFVPAASAVAPLWRWAYAYPIPSDIIRVLEVDRGSPVGAFVSNHMRRDQVDHEVQSGQILTNEGAIYCTGLRRVEDEGIFSSLFAHALAAKLAMLTCFAITQSRTQFEVVTAMYTGAIKEAKSRDGMQGTTRRMRSHWLTAARRGRR